MKKVIILFLFACYYFSMSYGQEVKTGLSAGINAAKWIGDADAFASDLADGMNLDDGFSGFSFNNKHRVAFFMGLFVDLQIKNQFSIQSELNYAQKGTKLKGDGYVTVDDGGAYYTFRVDENLTMQTDYIDLLLLPKYNLSDGRVKPYIFAGPGVSYLVTSKMKVKVTGDGDSDSDSEKYEGFKHVDAHLNVGFGLDFTSTIRLNARYQLGILSILDEDSNSGYDVRNSGIAVNLVAIF